MVRFLFKLFYTSVGHYTQRSCAKREAYTPQALNALAAQYIIPNAHRGIIWFVAYSISSRTTYLFKMHFS